MHHPVEKLIARFGVRISTLILVTLTVLIATLFDYIYYTLLRPMAMYDGWFYSDILIASAVGWPIISTLLKLTAKNRSQQKELQMVLLQVKELKDMLPMCAGCKNIRDERGEWHNPAVYIRDNTNSQVSHSLCPDCMQRIYE